MSMVATRLPLQTIGMNGARGEPRRSTRLSAEGLGENEAPTKQTRGAQSGDAVAETGTKKRPRKVYEHVKDDFTYSKSTKRTRTAKAPAVRNSHVDQPSPAAESTAAPPAAVAKKAPEPVRVQSPVPAAASKAAPKPARRRGTAKQFPTTPERAAASKPSRQSKRLSNEHVSSSPSRAAAHAKSHTNHDRSPSPGFRPVTVGKKRKKQGDAAEEDDKTTRIALPFADTPIIKRNKEMRKASADTNRRSSSGMRGKRASSLIDEGRGNGESRTSVWKDTSEHRDQAGRDDHGRAAYNDEQLLTLRSDAALPHAEVPTAEFYKHIGVDLTEPRRMRCLLGWCGSRALPPKPEAPKNNTKDANDEFQALQAARVIQEEVSLDLVSKGSLSDWFSRDEGVQPQVPLWKKPNPRNLANTTKAEELERELERLKKERQSWDTLMKSAIPPSSPAKASASDTAAEIAPGALSPLHADLLSSPDRAIFEQLNQATAPDAIQDRLQTISSTLEFSIDQFAENVHAMATTRDTAESVAEKSLKDAAEVLDDRAKQRRDNGGGGVGTMAALRGLARVLNGRR